MIMSSPFSEAVEAFNYLENDLLDSIKDECSFDTFNRLTLDRYFTEELDRFCSMDAISDTGSFCVDFLNECEELYDNLSRHFEEIKLEQDNCEWVEGICLTDKEILKEAFKRRSI